VVAAIYLPSMWAQSVGRLISAELGIKLSVTFPNLLKKLRAFRAFIPGSV
jgi:hypothetical protein